MEGAQRAGVLFMRSLASVSCLYFILLTVPFTELLAVLRRMKMPVLLTDLLLVMYRFVFVFL
ncbi:CbiQ family ECF transporter T component, partial [Acinetobacter baumannii]|uniref:CbiQ family ECF transporter T component n=1 Tax=Acinetobacter baumannii TaxID=470 RepID=UPI001F0B12AB